MVITPNHVFGWVRNIGISRWYAHVDPHPLINRGVKYPTWGLDTHLYHLEIGIHNLHRQCDLIDQISMLFSVWAAVYSLINLKHDWGWGDFVTYSFSTGRVSSWGGI